MLSFFVWLSYVVVSLAGWYILSKGIGYLRFDLERKYLKNSKNILSNFAKFVTLAICYPSWGNFLADARFHFENNQLSKRSYMLAISLLPLGILTAIGIQAFLFLQINSSQLIVMSAVIWMLSRWFKNFLGWALASFGLGLFLFGAEVALKQSSLVFASTFESPLFFSLGDSLWTTILACFGIAMVVAALSQTHLVGFLTGGLLVLVGMSSLPVGFAFFLGEILGLWLVTLLIYRTDAGFGLLCWRMGICLVTSVLCLLALDDIQFIFQQLMPGGYTPDLRFRQYQATVSLFVVVDILVSATFFHFYYRKLSRSGKAEVQVQTSKVLEPWQEQLLSPSSLDLLDRP